MRQYQYKNNTSGFSLLEVVVALAIFLLVVAAMGAFTRDVFFFNDILQTGITNVGEARKVLRPFSDEVRRAQQSDAAAFPVATAAADTFTFYADVDADSSSERIRYFLDGDTFKKGVTEPSGTPPEYNDEDEYVTKVIRNVVSTSTVFTYYDSSYDGTTSTPALEQPVVTSDVRLVRIDLMVDANPNRAPSLLTITTQATIRNLKDNYEDNE